MPRHARIKHIGVIGRRWHARTYGNTYNSVQIFVNGNLVAALGKSYGGGSMYEDRATANSSM